MVCFIVAVFRFCWWNYCTSIYKIIHCLCFCLQNRQPRLVISFITLAWQVLDKKWLWSWEARMNPSTSLNLELPNHWWVFLSTLSLSLSLKLRVTFCSCKMFWLHFSSFCFWLFYGILLHFTIFFLIYASSWAPTWKVIFQDIEVSIEYFGHLE